MVIDGPLQCFHFLPFLIVAGRYNREPAPGAAVFNFEKTEEVRMSPF